MWFVYILKASDDSLYTGITKNIERRVQEHNLDNKRGSKSLRGKRPVTLAYFESCISRSEASKRESNIKSLTREEKLQLIFIGKLP